MVAKEGNLTRTASILNLSQSALSAQIKTLEAQLGLQLFDRIGKYLELTESGRLVLDYADAIYNTGEDLLQRLTQGLELHRRVLRVGAISTLSRNFQIEFLKPLFAQKDIGVVITSGTLNNLVHQLEQHQLDVVLTNTVPLKDSLVRLVIHRVSDQHVGLMGDPQGSYQGRSLEDLLNTEPIIVPTTESNIRIAFDSFVDRKGLKPQIVAEVSDMTMLRLLARERIGLTIVPRIVVKDELEQGLLQEIFVLPHMKETFNAITLMRRFPNPILKSLLYNIEQFS